MTDALDQCAKTLLSSWFLLCARKCMRARTCARKCVHADAHACACQKPIEAAGSRTKHNKPSQLQTAGKSTNAWNSTGQNAQNTSCSCTSTTKKLWLRFRPAGFQEPDLALVQGHLSSLSSARKRPSAGRPSAPPRTPYSGVAGRRHLWPTHGCRNDIAGWRCHLKSRRTARGIAARKNAPRLGQLKPLPRTCKALPTSRPRTSAKRACLADGRLHASSHVFRL